MKSSNPKLPIGNLTENLLLMAFMTVMLMVWLAGKTMAQEQSAKNDPTLFGHPAREKYRLDIVNVRLRSGHAFRGNWIGVSQDSLMFEYEKPIAGCVISLSNKVNNTWIIGKVISMSDSTITLSNTDHDHQVIPMDLIKEIRVKRYPDGTNPILDIRFVGISTVQEINVRKSQAPNKGFLIGGILGGVLGYGMGGGEEGGFAELRAISAGVAGFTLGALTGLAIGSAGRNFEINGSRSKSQKLINKIQK